MLLICHPLFPGLLVRPTKPEVVQLDGGGVLLVWKPVHSSDPVTYCVQYCTDGGFKRHMLTTLDQCGDVEFYLLTLNPACVPQPQAGTGRSSQRR